MNVNASSQTPVFERRWSTQPPLETPRTRFHSALGETLVALGLYPVSAAIFGAAGALLVIGLASLLPTGQVPHALAALAAGISVPMGFVSIRDQIGTRALFLAAVAAAAAVLAYASLPGQWELLGFSYSLLLAWTASQWIDQGARPALVGLATALAGIAAAAFGHL